MDPTLENLTDLLADYTGIEGIGFTDTLASLGLDSIDLIQITLEIEEHFKIELPERESHCGLTVADLHDAIQQAESLAA